MRLSEAILLGDVLKKGNPDKWLNKDGSCGCALGGALLAVGATAEEFIAEFDVKIQPRLSGMSYNESCKEFSEMLVLRKRWYWITAAHVLAISDLYHRVHRGEISIQNVADYVRSIEPDEPAESVETSQEVNSEKVTHAL